MSETTSSIVPLNSSAAKVWKQTVSPFELEVHEQLVSIYGENENRPDLESSIARYGIRKPLLVSKRTGRAVVVSGKCRLQIARRLGIAKVEIEIREYSTLEQEIEDMLIENEGRELKTNFQKIGEAMAWEAIESIKAKQRQRQNAVYLNQQLGRQVETNQENFPDSSKGQSRDLAASRVGMSGRSFEKGKKVADFIAQLRSNNRHAEADALQELLDRSVDGAYKFLSSGHRRDAVLRHIAEGQARTIEAAVALANLGNMKNFHRAVKEEMVLSFPESLLRQPSLTHYGRIGRVTDAYAEVWFRDKTDMSVEKFHYKLAQLPLPAVDEPNAEVRPRILALLETGSLDAFEREILCLLLRPAQNTDVELEYLRLIEQRYVMARVEEQRSRLLEDANTAKDLNKNAGSTHAA